MPDDCFKFKFISEIGIDFRGSYPSRICIKNNHLFIPAPEKKKILCFDAEMNPKKQDFFSGDQNNPRPYCFARPVAVTFSYHNGYCVCDKAESNILFFGKSGFFKYAKSPPGFVEYAFVQPENIVSISSRLAVIDAGHNLNILDSRGRLKTINIPALPGSGEIAAGCLAGFNEKFYVFNQNANLLCVDPFSSRIEEIDLPVGNIKGKPRAVCFDSAGNFYIILTDPAALILLDSERLDVMAKYEHFGYNSGDLRDPVCLDIGDNKGTIYIIDDNRLMKFKLTKQGNQNV